MTAPSTDYQAGYHRSFLLLIPRKESLPLNLLQIIVLNLAIAPSEIPARIDSAMLIFCNEFKLDYPLAVGGLEEIRTAKPAQNENVSKINGAKHNANFWNGRVRKT